MVKIRLRRTGKKKQPSYQIIAIDARKKRQGNYLEKIGHYFPLNDKYDINQKKVLKWLDLGAKPTTTVKNFLVKAKIMQIFEKKKTLTKKNITEKSSSFETAATKSNSN